jgi:FkbM family methyltransferase
VNLKDYLNFPSPIEREIRFFLKKENSSVVLDIGACEGEDSIRYKRMFPNSMIFSFEPLPSNIEKMKKNFEIYGIREGIEIVPFALSDEEGIADFFVSSGAPRGKTNNEEWNYGNKSSSLLPPAEGSNKYYSWLEFKQKIKVGTRRLDNFLNEKRPAKVDLIHMDVQGAELLVLKGAGSWVKKICLIWLEASSVELYKSQALKNDLEKYLKEHGFVKLKDTISSVCGDQCYINSTMIDPLKLSLYKMESFIHTCYRKVMRRNSIQ